MKSAKPKIKIGKDYYARINGTVYRVRANWYEADGYTACFVQRLFKRICFSDKELHTTRNAARNSKHGVTI